MKKYYQKIFSLFIVMGTLFFVLTGCSKKDNSSSNKISIVTSTNVYADIAQNVLGKYGKATAIITSSSTDPHDFEPTTADAKKVQDAKIIVANGLGYDSWLAKLAKSSNKSAVLVGEDLMNLKSGDNPHIWFDLNMPTKYVNYLVKRLSKIDKKHANYYKEHGTKYLEKIKKVQKIADSIDGTKQKPVYVSEPVFDYALKATHFKIGDKAFEEAIENETDPSAKIVHQMNQTINNRDISFFVKNSQVNSSTVNNFVKRAKSKKIPILQVRETILNNTTYLKWITENYQNLANINKKLK
ncbi:metal ABC transporter substrate-binding protein [Lactobacillus gasseri]|uniref:metal ABC transporter solute-binding protein, Zn/Mn family n=1 Tax=Lactobacillus gasseri TaxID=1596 RepID=UPI000C9C9371|nr:zinc ABC transporter substrate-binding protein [Lactobacillus gasseri]PMC33389.1 metal ABC transporter substrate-binding protein [Lactobacillus gasseri]